MKLSLRTFGGLSVSNSGRPMGVAAAQRARLALLARLATAGDRGVSRDGLLALFWPESDMGRARGALNQALYALRRDLGEQDLILGTADLKLNPAVIRSDVEEFDSLGNSENAALLEQAVALYAGPFLDGVFVKDAPEFERWADAERRRLAGRHQRLLETLATDAQRRDDRRAAVRWFGILAVADRTSARVAMLYMEALARADEREAAVRHALIHAGFVRAELDVDADPGVHQLAEQLAAPANGAWTRLTSPLNGVLLTTTLAEDVTLPHRTASEPAVRNRRALPLGPRRLRQLVIIGLIAVTAGAVIHRSQSAPATSGSVVVLPFDNETGDTTLSVVGRMSADWISEGLRQTGLVDVIDGRIAAGPASTRHADPAERVAEAARRGASTIVRGVLYREHDMLIVHTQLVRVSDARVLIQLAAVSGPVAEPARLVEAVRQRVLGTFAALGDARFDAWKDGHSAAPRYDAYQEFITGLADQAQRKPTAYSHFFAAAQLDTDFVQAKLYAIETIDGESRDSVMALRDSLLRSAISQRLRLAPYDRWSLDRRVAEAQGDLESMLHDSREMVKMAPHSYDAHVWHALDAVSTNRFREALAEMHRERLHDRVRGPSPVPGLSIEPAFYARWDPLMHHLAGEYDMELASRGSVPGQDGSDEDRCMEAARPLAAMGRAREVDSLFGTCGRLTTAALPGWWLLEIGREYRAHGHDADARRTLLRARAKYVAAGRGGQDEMPFASFPLGEWQHVRDGWRDTTQLQSAGARGYGQLGIAMAHLGDTARAVVAESTLARSIHHPDGHALLWVAMIEEALGHRARALDYLRQAVVEGVPAAVMLHTHVSTGFASMRGDPAFEVWRQGR